MITNREQPTVLIIDDEPQIRELLLQLLMDDYHCVGVASAEEALTVLDTQNVGVIVSDICMSGLSGLDLLPLVRRKSPDSVIIMVSGQNGIGNAIEAMRCGAFDYILKPFDLPHVEAAVRRAAEHHCLLLAKREYGHHLEESLKRRTEEIKHLSYRDNLTGLPNALRFKDCLSQTLDFARRNNHQAAVLLAAVDGFKKLNDALGHSIAEQVLREVAARLRSCADDEDSIARLEGEEFAILLEQIGGTEDAARLCDRIRRKFKSPFMIEEHELFVTLSLGISIFPQDGNDVHSLLKGAGAALNRAMDQGGDNVHFYSTDITAEALARLSLENSLRRAPEREELVLHYQPLLDLKTRRIVGAEALVRWQHTELGLIPPSDFIPLAEETGLIVAVGEWTLRAACSQNKRWQALLQGQSPLRVSVNLSSRQFRQPNLVETVRRALAETELPPQQLEIELTESSIMDDEEHGIKVLHRLKDLGVTIAIDDFGTGYSSLSYLKRLPIDKLKIDRSFMQDATDNPDDAAIIMALITLAHNLGLRVVAEGVETESQSAFLRLLRCDEAQGYLFSPPIPANAFEQLLRSGHDMPAVTRSNTLQPVSI